MPFGEFATFYLPKGHQMQAFSPNRFTCRGSHGVGIRGLALRRAPLTLPASTLYRKYRCLVSWPSKTHRKINKFKELLHSVREWHNFCELAWLRAPWEPQMLLRCCQVLNRCFKNHNFGHESSPHGSPRHDTLSQRSATPPRSSLSLSQAPEIQFPTQKFKESRKFKKNKIKNHDFPVWCPTLGSFILLAEELLSDPEDIVDIGMKLKAW